MKMGSKMSIESRKRISNTVIKKYVNGYTNPMKGKRRTDVVEYNKKYKSEQMRGDNNPSRHKKVIEKRMRTIRRRTKEIYGRKGKLNGNWKGGISKFPYNYDFNKELKLAIKFREGFKCFICKVNEDQTTQGLSIHHIDYDKSNSELNNLVALCPKCHTKTNGKRKNWIEYFSQRFNIKKIYFTYVKIQQDCKELSRYLFDKNITGIVPIKRGGVIPSVILSFLMNIPIKDYVTSEKDVIVDEVVDFGMTFRRNKKEHPKNLFVCLYLNSKHFKYKQYPDFFVSKVDKWIVFPWEYNDKVI